MYILWSYVDTIYKLNPSRLEVLRKRSSPKLTDDELQITPRFATPYFKHALVTRLKCRMI